MEPRRCDVHGLVVGADGRCVVCRRGDPELGTPRRSQEWPLVVALAFVAVLVVFSGGYWLTRKLAAMSVKPPQAIAGGQPTEVVDEPPPPPPPPRPNFAVNDKPQEASRPALPPAELSEAEIERLKRGVRVTMYSTPKCELCATARTFLKARGYKLNELDIEASPTDKVLLESLNPAGSVPTFDVAGKVMVGYDRQSLDRAIQDAAVASRSR